MMGKGAFLAVGLAAGLALGAVGVSLAHYPGGYGGESWMGPGMMGYRMGPGMMAPDAGEQGEGYGPGMMGRAGQPGGWHHGPWHHGPGYRGPGYGGMGPGMGPGAMGWGMGSGMMRHVLPNDLEPDQVRHVLEHQLAWQGNPNLKVGKVEAKDDDTIVGEIVTSEGSLVQRLEIDRHTGLMRPAEAAE